MIYSFGGVSLDTGKGELRVQGRPAAVEPQVFALLRHLVENRERLVDKDEIIREVWKGRIVSDAAISSRIKSARQAVGDSGSQQGVIRTVAKRGFRFVAEVEVSGPAHVASPALEPLPALAQAQPSIAVLPFTVVGGGEPWIADALPHDLIAAMSRLRWLFVIARASSFRFRGPQVELAEVREALGVRYCLSGVVTLGGRSLSVMVELSDTRDGRVVWSDRFRAPMDGVHEVREQIVSAVVNALDLEIPLSEARRAALSAPQNLDAWSAFHLGLRHLYRFTREGAAHAADLFRHAVRLEPGFARAHAGLSFAHFEAGFLRFAEDASQAADLARGCAEDALALDPLDPFCNLVMGRAHWLTGDLECALPWLERADSLNPNYAQARYSRAWTETLLGDGARGMAGADAALRLSPLDPLAYGMLGVKSLACVVEDDAREAAAWASRAARSPGAHALIDLMAAVTHRLAGDETEARSWTRTARNRHPGLSGADFLEAFPLRQERARRRVASALAELGV